MSYLMELSKVIVGIAANSGATIPEGLLDVWAEAFQQDGYSIDQIKRAAGKIIRTKKESYGRMPSYAEFVECMNGSLEETARIEVQDIIALVRSEGSSGNPSFKLQTSRVILNRFGGWQNLCSTLEEDKIQWFIREFIEAYLTETAKDEKVMIGKDEAGNTLKKLGFETAMIDAVK